MFFCNLEGDQGLSSFSDRRSTPTVLNPKFPLAADDDSSHYIVRGVKRADNYTA